MSAVGFAAVADADDFNCAIASLTEDEPPVADAKAVLRWIEAFQLLHAAGIGYKKPG